MSDSDREVLDEIFDIAHDPHLKVTAVRKKIRSLLAEAGFEEDDGHEEEDD